METVENIINVAAPETISAPALQPDATGIYHPASEADIQSLISKAKKNKAQLRVAGAVQSVADSVYTDQYLEGEGAENINIMLDNFRSVTYNESLMQVTVGAGLNLGFNPFDPTKISTEENGLFFQLQQKGWAIANVTNAIHQTVGGFISTGSSAGSMMHSFDECILSFRIIDGNSNAVEFTKTDDPDNEFYAIGSSMGLLGIIVSVTLQCIPAFNIIGQEKVSKITECEMDFFGPGSATQPSLQNYLSDTEFSRLLWWPVKSLQRSIAWKAKTMVAGDYTLQTGGPQDFNPKPYQPIFPKIFNSTLPSEEVASIGFKLIAKWPQWLYDMLGNSIEEKIIVDVVDKIAPYLYPLLIDMYFPCNDEKRPPQQFWDTWLGSLPMDKIEFGNRLFDLSYAEIGIPIEKTRQVVNLLQQHYIKGGYEATGYYTVEILAAKNSNFWMSPAYGQNLVRLNIMRFDDGASNNMMYYQQFWDLLVENNIDFRVHWGKYLPPYNSSTGAAFLKKQYSKWDNFMALRTNMDPDNIFLNSYWKTHLGIES